jgi:hypothetical protein
LLPAPRPLVPKLDGAVGGAARQGLRIGVGADELYTLTLQIDHVLDGVAATAADSDHFDLGALVKISSSIISIGHVSFSWDF